MEAIKRISSTLAKSSWAPILGRGAVVGLALVVLAAIGVGFGDRLLGRPIAIANAGEPTAPPLASSASAPFASATPIADAGLADAAAGMDADAPAPAVTGDGKVLLNAATEDDLRRLPGIGASKAHAILALRTKLGRFRRVEDLLRVKGIGRRSIARLRPLIVVD